MSIIYIGPELDQTQLQHHQLTQLNQHSKTTQILQIPQFFLNTAQLLINLLPIIYTMDCLIFIQFHCLFFNHMTSFIFMNHPFLQSIVVFICFIDIIYI